jgi:hypothetical protein
MLFSSLSWHRSGRMTVAWIAKFSLGVVLFLLISGASRADSLLKPTGTAENNVSVWAVDDAIPEQETALITADYLLAKDLPSGVVLPAGAVGAPITFGVWQGDSHIYTNFDPSIVVNIKYDDRDVPADVQSEEQSLHVYMYHPAFRGWVKLCSSVQIDENVISAALARVVPFEAEGGVLLAIAPDNLPLPNQDTDSSGVTELEPPNTDLRLQIQSNSIPDGTHFVITALPRPTATNSLQFLSDPVDIKACQVDHTNPTQNTVELTSFFFKQPRIGFKFNADTLSKAGRTTNLTVASLFDNQTWIDLEAFGSRLIRERREVAVDTPVLGVFDLAAR